MIVGGEGRRGQRGTPTMETQNVRAVVFGQLSSSIAPKVLVSVFRGLGFGAKVPSVGLC